MSEHKPMTKFTDECICGNVWPCPTDLERQLAEAQERGKLLWRTSGEWLGSWHATRRILLSHVEALTETEALAERRKEALALFPKIAGCHRKRLLLADAEVECDHCDKLMAEIRELCAAIEEGTE